MRSLWLGAVLLSAIVVASCGEGPTGDPDAGGATGGGAGGGATGGGIGGGATGGGSGGGSATCTPPANLTRAQQWQRSNRMFISGLNVVMPAPTPAQVTDYFSSFHATALHTWATGFPNEVPARIAAAAPASVPYVTWMNQDGTSAWNGQLLGGLTPPAGRIGYQVSDEPMDVATFQAMATGAAAVRTVDPNGLLIVNFAPGINTWNTIAANTASFAPFDVVSMDQYDYGKNVFKGLARTRAVAMANGKVWWRYLDSYFESPNTDSATEADLRWDAHVGIAYGYTGHTWFLYQVDPGPTGALRTLLFSSSGDYGSAKTPQFTWAANVNLELANLGRAMVLLRNTDVRYVARLLQPAETTAWAVGAGNDPYLAGVAPQGTLGPEAIVGSFRDDCDEPYAFVMTNAHPGGDWPNSSSANQTIRLSFNFASSTDASLDKTAILVLDPVTGQVSPRALTSTGADTATIDLNLRAGAGVLFKYKNARPFALQP